MTYNATDSEATAQGFILPTGTDLIRNGDNAIKHNAKTAAGGIRAARDELARVFDPVTVEQVVTSMTLALAAEARAADAATRAENAEAAALEVPDANVSALIGNDTTNTRQALEAAFASLAPYRSPAAPLTFTEVTTNLIAMHVSDVDGGVYGSNAIGLGLRRNLTGFTGPDEAGPTLPAASGQAIHFAARVAEGYVAVTGNITADTGEIWFSTSWGSGWAKVKDIRNAENFTISRPIINPATGGTVIVVGEYASGGTQARELWLTEDGGQTWRGINPRAAVDTSVNNHWHAAQGRVIDGILRIYAAHGDKANAWFGYTDDLGATWTDLPALGLGSAYEHAQPTVLVPMLAGVANSGDAGGRGMDSGVLMTDPDSGVTWRALNGTPDVPDFHQWGRGPWAGDGITEAYVTYPQATGFYTSGFHYIAATGDGGRSWHTVWTQPADGPADRDYNNGIVGPDPSGRIFMAIKSDGVRKVLVSQGVTWQASAQRAVKAAAQRADVKDVLQALGYLPADTGPTDLDLDGGHFVAGSGGVDGPKGTDHGFTIYADGQARWQIVAMEDTETGSNAGTSLGIRPIRDDGTVSGNVITLYRDGSVRLGVAGNKIGFYGIAPVARPAAVNAQHATPAGATYGANEQQRLDAVTTRVSQIVNRLQVLGLIN